MGLFWTTVSGKSAVLGNTLMTSAIGAGVDTLRSKFANGFKDTGVKFYYNAGAGGKIVNVAARKLTNVVADMAKDEADKFIKKSVRKLFGGKKLDNSQTSATWLSEQEELAAEEEKNYGKLHNVFALDDWGNPCHDAVMLAIPVNPAVSNKVSTYSGKAVSVRTSNDSVDTASMEGNNWLVWYDTTGLVSTTSDKNLVLTSVVGRDYSRKELVNNGDLRFSVTGRITSTIPDIYPSKEVQKFRQIMRYRGIVDVNNEIFAQWGVTKIAIQSFNLPTSEGNKAVQEYSFECVGIQPDTEANVKSDTIKVYDKGSAVSVSGSKALTWKDVIKNQVAGAAQNITDVSTEGTALATGMLDGLF